MLKGNKGEWSETYTFLKLLAEGKIYAADENLQRIDSFYPLIKIDRAEKDNSHHEYIYGENISVRDCTTNTIIKEIPCEYFLDQSTLLLDRIISETGSSFSVPEIEDFLSSLQITTLKARSDSKSDIKISVHDLNTGLQPDLSFSIKSRLGNPSTLFNANKEATNFIYKITGEISESDISRINSINSRSKVKDRIQEIIKLGCALNYHDVPNDILKMNLQLIDSMLPNILGEMLLTFFSGSTSTVKDILDIVTAKNPCNFNTLYNHKFYEYKVKNFLTDIALGMTPREIWDGRYDATGGYIIVKENGELICYHIYNRNEFQDYLLNQTKFESPSTNRHQYGLLYHENGELYLKLNLQIRFIK